ncbi:MAG TPA: gamma carbonic anhydrase family protein [Pirellulaceae bacterium]|nr:gamma carbonic anhydrase family protein [Pirellulaceae bacterium]
MFEFDLSPHPELISPEAWIAPSADVVGRVRVGAESSVWYGAVVRGDLELIEIGDATNVQDLSLLHTNAGVACRLGDRVTIGHGAIVHGAIIEDDVLIGMRAIVLNHARICTGSFVAAGSLIPEGMEVPPGWLAWGSPAQLVRPVDEALAQRIHEAADHYREITRNLVAGVCMQRDECDATVSSRQPRTRTTAREGERSRPVPSAKSARPRKRARRSDRSEA